MPLLIRDGTAADLAAITTIFLAAFASEPLIARTHPHAAQYPSHPHLYYRRFFEARFWGPEQQILRVAVDAATDEPVAFAWFRRPWRAADAAARAAHEGPATLRFWLAPPARAARALAAWLWPCRSVDAVHGNAFAAMHHRVEARLVAADPRPPRRRDAWYLSTLAVDPAVQGQGAGSWLVRDALSRVVDPEGAACWLIGLEGVEPFYDRFGFREVDRANEGRLADWTGGAVMIRESS
ncbi:hypothetical protein VD0002_g1748 [Verticillium dahliae]|uniref:N-acetyltransferase domain-containing protein n=1 Tax=Verticillium dahliae TaxID=27337 RepID=A0A2J8BY38_VERDA|nr:hypothetical protein BJF96_g7127 [Verticillium dahliae]PNH55136.1 hypothetical protein VD0003_g2454 [Verticillium dahliae]PNH68247.1 hypothetical protein VD0002_g1748 [Verticillium dahliae]RXG47442.1 hypothetical protein VDGE_00118 [Verticillium dahliae]